MTELAIHRFSLSLVRMGGCSWGTERERIFAAMHQALPAALGEAFAARVEGQGELAIDDPIRLDVHMSLAELEAACTSIDAMAMLARQIVAAWTPPEAMPSKSPSEPITEPTLFDTESAIGAHDPIVATLLAWHRRDELVTMLAGFSTGALQRWLAALVPSLPAVEPAHVQALVRALETPRADDSSTRDALREVIVEVVRVFADVRSNTRSVSLAEVVTRAIPRLSEPAAARDVTHPPRSLAAPEVTEPAISPPARARHTAPVRIAPPTAIDGFALPFLLLRPLGQIGALDVLAASCAANDVTPSVFAAALALAVLRPPDRGWRHDAADLATAAAFAGEPTLPSFALGSANDLVAPIDRVLARAVLAGHDGVRPLLLHRSSEGFLLVEPAGLFPIAWQDTVADILAVAAPIGSLVAVTSPAADAATLATLDAYGMRFLTDAAPSRHERWRRLSGARAWTNDCVAADEVLAPHSGYLALAEDVDELVALLVSRRPRDLPAPIARASGLAAAIALGDIAHRLWRDREPTSPQLAFARMGDLSARIVVSSDQIDVRIPYGARHRDLARAGFLAAPMVPWLGSLAIGVG
jgi:hypothetical protein